MILLQLTRFYSKAIVMVNAQTIETINSYGNGSSVRFASNNISLEVLESPVEIIGQLSVRERGAKDAT